MQEGKIMKNKINNQLLVLTTLSAIAMNGCVSKTVEVSETPSNKVETSKWKPAQGKSLAKSKRDDCVDCYVAISKKTPLKIAFVKDSNTVYSYDYSKAPSEVYPVNDRKYEGYENPYPVDDSYDEDNPYLVDASYREDTNEYNDVYAKKNYVSSKTNVKDYSSKRSIQVGAFRKYASAKVYAKRYSLLTSQYNVEIKENVKNNKPIYRVQIEGFSNQYEAKKFTARYGLNGAFLVRR